MQRGIQEGKIGFPVETVYFSLIHPDVFLRLSCLGFLYRYAYL